jgi:hypothetical protein
MNKELRAEARRSIDHLIARGFINEANIIARVTGQLEYAMDGNTDEEPSYDDIESLSSRWSPSGWRSGAAPSSVGSD